MKSCVHFFPLHDATSPRAHVRKLGCITITLVGPPPPPNPPGPQLPLGFCRLHFARGLVAFFLVSLLKLVGMAFWIIKIGQTSSRPLRVETSFFA